MCGPALSTSTARDALWTWPVAVSTSTCKCSMEVLDNMFVLSRSVLNTTCAEQREERVTINKQHCTLLRQGCLLATSYKLSSSFVVSDPSECHVWVASTYK